jgi:hypothetical protein
VIIASSVGRSLLTATYDDEEQVSWNGGTLKVVLLNIWLFQVVVASWLAGDVPTIPHLTPF